MTGFYMMATLAFNELTHETPEASQSICTANQLTDDSNFDI